MRILKLKSIGFSLMALAITLTFLLTACEKTEKTAINETQINGEISEYLNGKYIVLPLGYEEDVDYINYLQNADKDLIDKLVENYRIAEFLHQIDLFWEVKSQIKKGDHLADIDLSKYLNAKQMLSLKDFLPNERLIEERGCKTITTDYPCKTKKCCTHPLYGTYCYTVGNFC